MRLRLGFQEAFEKLPHHSLQKRLCCHEEGEDIPKDRDRFRTGINDPGYIEAMECVNYHLAAILPQFLKSENRKFCQD